MKNEMEKVSYIIGQQIGGDLRNQGIGADIDILAQSLTSAFKGEPSIMDPQEMQTVMASFQQKTQTKMQDDMQKTGEENTKTGATYLALNKEKEGVVGLASGLQYKIINEGEGEGKKPSATDTVETHYEGQLIDGSVFDSSYKRGETATFPVNGVIAGWTEALQLMGEGAKWELYIPAELAYGPAGSPPVIGPNSTLIFQVELISVK